MSGWPEESVLQGEGRRCGQLPRGAGVIAIVQVGTDDLVCICEKRNGKRSFPKGGLHRKNGCWETVLRGAKREWREETGISIGRLQINQGAHVDDAIIGTRYLVARCDPADSSSQEPDAVDSLEWQPPYEDVTDTDPIVKAFWIPVKQVLAGRAGLSKDRCGYLRQALDLLRSDYSLSRCGGSSLPSDFSAVASVASKTLLENSTLATISSTLSITEKEVMKLAKKLREIKKIEAMGRVLNTQQRQKLAKKNEFRTKLCSLLAELPQSSDVRSKLVDLSDMTSAGK
jgi:8-oxo-dGTP pyrophosphatase MutT (NUDIX family)